MKELLVYGQLGNSKILIGEHISNLKEYLSGKKTFIITDKNINHLYRKFFNDFPVIVLPTGEQTKSLNTIESLIETLLEKGADRNSFLVGIGGGIVCDITGFTASVFMRGIDFGFISTSLLAQVDASVGGKNGINFHSYKNLIGTFNQPQFVLCDINMLKTLPEKEIRCGWGEVIKHALIADRQLFDDIAGIQNIFLLNNDFYTELVFRNIQIKAGIVNRDEKETNERKKLNFGHTFGHAIERITGLSHGEAVVGGIYFATWWSKEQNLLNLSDFLKINNLLKQFYKIKISGISPEEVFETIKKDKKRNRNKIDFVFLSKIGHAEIKTVSMKILAEAIKKYFSENE